MLCVARLGEKYGHDLEGVGKAVIDVLTRETTTYEKADYLVYIGAVSQACEPYLSGEAEGMPFYKAALQLRPEHFEACCQILESYMLPFSGHTDTPLARDCLRIIEQRHYDVMPEYLERRRNAIGLLQHHGVNVDVLRGSPNS